MITREIVVTLPGHPAPKGSLKCVGQGGKHSLIEDNKRTKPWRDKVATLVRSQLATVSEPADPHQAIDVELTLTLPRPPAHYGTGRNASKVKPSSPAHPTGHRAGDVDKLARTVLDALQDAGVVADDSQIVELLVRKCYPDAEVPDSLDYPGARIRITPHGLYAESLL